MSGELVATENPGVFIISSNAIFKKSSQGLTAHVLLLFCCTGIDIIVDDRRGKDDKYVIMVTLDPNPNPNLNWNVMW